MPNVSAVAGAVFFEAEPVKLAVMAVILPVFEDDTVWDVRTFASIRLSLPEMLQEPDVFEPVFGVAIADEEATALPASEALPEACEACEATVLSPEVVRKEAPPTPSMPPWRGLICDVVTR